MRQLRAGGVTGQEGPDVLARGRAHSCPCPRALWQWAQPLWGLGEQQNQYPGAGFS